LSGKCEAIKLAGFAYEKTYSDLAAKKDGVFYTPPELVSFMVQRILPAKFPPKKPLRVLDPACGSGLFLLEAFFTLFSRSDGVDSSLTRASFLLEECIFGVDKDPNAVATAQRLLAEAFFELTHVHLPKVTEARLYSNLVTGNSILDPSGLSKSDVHALAPISWSKIFPRVFIDGGFDVIVGNPPYGLSRDGQLGQRENALLKIAFHDFREGKLNKYLAFMAKSYELLKRNGILSFVVPNAWLGIRGGRKMRRLFLEDGALREIVVFDDPIFLEPGVEAVVFEAIKCGGLKDFRITKRSRQTDTKNFLTLKTCDCLSDPDARIPLHGNEEIQKLLCCIDRSSIPLCSANSPFLPMIALQAYAKGKGVPPQTAEVVKNHPFHSQQKVDEFSYPYLEGKDIGRYRLHWSGRWLRHGKWLAEPQTLDRFSGPRIVLREITCPLPYMISASYVEETMLYNKSVLHILGKKGCTADEVWALLAIINSALGSLILYLRGRKTQRKLFPKLVSDDLKHFPLPKSFSTLVPLLSTWAKAEQINGDDLGEIDEIMFEAYGLSQFQKDLLKQYLLSLTDSAKKGRRRGKAMDTTTFDPV
jgi:hypothetical protein